MQVFSCKHRITFKNTYFEEHLRTAASERKALIYTNEILKFTIEMYGHFSIFFT